MAKSKLRHRFLASLVLTVFLLAAVSTQAQAVSCDEKYNCDAIDKTEAVSDYNNCLVEQKNCWSSKITQAQAEANTLQSAIDVLNGQINLQSVKIQQTIYEIETLEREITELNQRIEGLGVSLNKLSGILIARVRESYKQSRRQFKVNFFASESFNQFLSQYRYIHHAQEQTLDLMKKHGIDLIVLTQSGGNNKKGKVTEPVRSRIMRGAVYPVICLQTSRI